MAQDYGHAQTSKMLSKMERRVNREYSQAAEEIQQKLEDYLQRYETKNKIKLEKLAKGEITQEEYSQWRTGQIAVGKRWEEMRDTLAQDLTNTNQIAASIVNGYTPDVYALNHNFGTYEAETGALVDTSYTLYDRQTVERLIKENPALLPQAKVEIDKDLQWNRQKLTSAITQGILQGEGIDRIAKRLMNVTDMNRKQAIRNARTMTTSAENAGRADSYVRAKDMGIDMEQIWLATLDGRTRDSHRALDGEAISVGDKWHHPTFSNGCRYPGDPQGRPEEVYNCRCTLIAKVKGAQFNVTDTGLRNNYKLGDMTYQEWKAGHTTKQKEQTVTGTTFTGIRTVLGDDFVDAMETLLNFTPETDVKDLFYKYSDQLQVVDANLADGAYFDPNKGGVCMNADSVERGDALHDPYQTAFHEFGHNVDWLAQGGSGQTMNNYASNAYGNGKLQRTIKSDWRNFKSQYLKDNYQSVFSLSKSGIRTDDMEFNPVYFRSSIRGLKSADLNLRTLTGKHRRGEISDMELLNGLSAAQLNELTESFVSDDHMVSILRKENMSLSARGSISDIIEGCTGISYPLGAGHGSSYHKKTPGITALEFFAETVDGKAANPQSLEQMRRIFPNGVKVVEEIIQEVIK